MLKNGGPRGKIFYAFILILSTLVWLTACASSPQSTSQPSQSTLTSTQSQTSTTESSVYNIPVNIKITAENFAFDKSELGAYAGSSVTLEFNNKDTARHNVAFYTDDTATDPIFVGDIIEGPQTITYKFTAPLEPGIYFFRCDVHPKMNGEFIVAGTTS